MQAKVIPLQGKIEIGLLNSLIFVFISILFWYLLAKLKILDLVRS